MELEFEYTHPENEDGLTGQQAPIELDQIPNAEGGYVYELDIWGRLDRFLILGSDEATYYASKDVAARAGEDTVRQALDANPTRTVARIVNVSMQGRAPKNDAAIKALAFAASDGNVETRQLALSVLPLVCRTGTHLFQFVAQVDALRSWGRALTRAVGAWYTAKTPDDAAFQMVKYQGRTVLGQRWTHRDVLRLAHPKPATDAHNELFRWAVNKDDNTFEWHNLPSWALVFEKLHVSGVKSEVIGLIRQYGVPWEFVPSYWLGQADVWAALLPNMPLGALVRNLGRMTANGLLTKGSDAAKLVTARLADVQAIRKARLHPIALLSALSVYNQGHGERGQLSWTPVTDIVGALNEAFYLSFQTVEPSGESMLLGIDVSSSMTGGNIAGIPGLTPNVCAAAMAMATARVEPDHIMLGFSRRLVNLGITPTMRLDEVIRNTRMPFGATDCALPVLWALEAKVKVDKFVIYTDGETWAGETHVAHALRDYRDTLGVDAKLIQVAMTATKGSLNCPEDARALDVVGFDTATPQLISNF